MPRSIGKQSRESMESVLKKKRKATVGERKVMVRYLDQTLLSSKIIVGTERHALTHRTKCCTRTTTVVGNDMKVNQLNHYNTNAHNNNKNST